MHSTDRTTEQWHPQRPVADRLPLRVRYMSANHMYRPVAHGGRNCGPPKLAYLVGRGQNIPYAKGRPNPTILGWHFRPLFYNIYGWQWPKMSIQTVGRSYHIAVWSHTDLCKRLSRLCKIHSKAVSLSSVCCRLEIIKYVLFSLPTTVLKKFRKNFPDGQMKARWWPEWIFLLNWKILTRTQDMAKKQKARMAG